MSKHIILSSKGSSSDEHAPSDMPTSGGSDPLITHHPNFYSNPTPLNCTNDSSEARQLAIAEAHAALMTDTPIDTDTPPVGKASRSRTTHGRLESSGRDIYEFDPADLEVVKPRKKRKKRDGAVVLADDSSSDDWTPGGGGAKIGKTSARKATRSNTVGNELAPLLPKPTRRKSKTRFDGDLSLGLDPDKDKPSANSFVVDLTNDDLVLATQKKKEYDTVSSDLSASCNGVTPPGFTNFAGSSSGPSLQSTFMDSPEDGAAVPRQPWGLEYTNPPMPALKGPGKASLPVLNPPSLEPSTESAGLSPALVVSPPGVPTDGMHKGNVKKRSLTDQGVPPQSVASEWRAAKAKAVERSKTLSDIPPVVVVDLSDGDYDPSKKKKKKTPRKKRSKEVSKDKLKRAAKKQKNGLDKAGKDLDGEVLALTANPKVEVGSKRSIADSHDEEDDDDGDDGPVIPSKKKPKEDAQDMLMVAVAIQPQQASPPKPKPKTSPPKLHSRRIVDSEGEDDDEEEAHISAPAPVPACPPTDTSSTPPPLPPPLPTKRAVPEPATTTTTASRRAAKRPKPTAAAAPEAQPVESPPPPPPAQETPSPSPAKPQTPTTIAGGADGKKAKNPTTSTSGTTPATDPAARVPFRVGLSRRTRIPSLLKVFRK